MVDFVLVKVIYFNFISDGGLVFYSELGFEL